jgi:RNA polymerase sigma factor (sigma-70 family)
MEDRDTRALVIEDEESWQHILSEILADLGLEVDVAENLEAAVEAMRAAPHRLAVVDLSLDNRDHRNRDGLHALDAVRQYDPGCVPLLLTGYATVEIAVDALTQYGAFTCLRKENFTRSGFREVVREALANASPWLHDGGAEAGRAGGDASQARREESPAANGNSAGMALVVEDDAGWRNILSELLAEAGYKVRLCSGFAEALGCLGRDRYDLAVVDLSLSPDENRRSEWQVSKKPRQELNGLRLLASTRAVSVPTVVVSGVASPADIEQTYAEYGIFSCIEKQSFDRATFLETVQAVQSSDEVEDVLDALTDRERQVLALVARGMTNKQIAAELTISTNTVKRHLRSIFQKLGTNTRAAAAAIAVDAGLSIGWQTPEERRG